MADAPLADAPPLDDAVFDLAQYELDAASGWHLHRHCSGWAALPGIVLCHAPSQRCYDWQRRPVAYDYATGAVQLLRNDQHMQVREIARRDFRVGSEVIADDIQSMQVL